MTLSTPVAFICGNEGSFVAEPNLARLHEHEIGQKALGLTKLPIAWRPPFVVLAGALLQQTVDFTALARAVIDRFPSAQRLLVRSNAADEQIDSRGRFQSLPANATVDELAQVIREFLDVNRPILAEHSIPPSRLGALVQPFLEPTAKGHLSNENRHAQRNVNFLYEIEMANEVSEVVGKPLSFRLERPLIKPRPTELNLTRFNGDLPEALKHAARWIAANLDRGHVEWLVNSDRLWLVQFDPEQKPAAIRPLEVWNKQAATQFRGELIAFRRLDLDTLDSSVDRWRKTRSHRLVKAARLPVPPIYFLDNVDLLQSLEAGNVLESIASDLRSLTKIPLIVRIDVDLRFSDWQNMPMTGPTTSPTDVYQFIIRAITKARRREIPLADIAIVAHHFIPAKASAWATAQPDAKRVQIDATWGLPDGLQAFPCDVFNVLLDKQQVRRTPRYKDEFIDLDAQGQWLQRRSPPNLARRNPLSKTTALFVAAGTAEIAKRRGKATSVMWFVATDPKANLGDAIPWILDDAEEDTQSWSDDQSKDIAALVQKKVGVGTIRRLRNRDDLSKFLRNPADYDAGSKSVLFRPTAELVRDRDFLKSVAQAFSGPSEWYLVLEGSVLSHAPYQLRQFGAKRIISLGELVKPPRRTRVGKLVRDKIPAVIEARGETAVAVELSKAELVPALKKKLVEEALEVFHATAGKATLEELADVLAVMRAMAAQCGFDWGTIEQTERDKHAKRGGFERGVFLATTSPDEAAAASPSEVQKSNTPVRRLRYRTGFAVSLVPPHEAGPVRHDLKFTVGSTLVHLSVRYDKHDVTVTFERPEHEQSPSQLGFDFFGGVERTLGE